MLARNASAVRYLPARRSRVGSTSRIAVEEARRWLYGDYLPVATSCAKFSRLLAAIGASEDERNGDAPDRPRS